MYYCIVYSAIQPIKDASVLSKISSVQFSSHHLSGTTYQHIHDFTYHLSCLPIWKMILFSKIGLSVTHHSTYCENTLLSFYADLLVKVVRSLRSFKTHLLQDPWMDIEFGQPSAIFQLMWQTSIICRISLTCRVSFVIWLVTDKRSVSFYSRLRFYESWTDRCGFWNTLMLFCSVLSVNCVSY